MAQSSTPFTGQRDQILQAAIDALPDPFFVKDTEHHWIVGNRALADLLGQPLEAIIGRTDADFLPADQVVEFYRTDDEVCRSGEPNINEEPITLPDGSRRMLWTRKFPVRDESGTIVGLMGTITDITELKHLQDSLSSLEADLNQKLQVIEDQDRMLNELAAPVIQIWDRVLLLPLVGAVSSHRAMQVMTDLLQAVEQSAARIALLDITGVPIVDTSVANHLMQTVQAAQLLGCQCVLVGIGPEIAQTLVQLNVDFGQIVTMASLQDGLEYALRRLNYSIS